MIAAVPLSWKLAIGALLATLVAAAMWWAFGQGKQAERAGQLHKTIETQRDITDADAHGPRTPDDVDRRLRDGTF